MKQKDWLTLSLFIALSAVLSLFVSGQFFSTPEDRAQKVEVVEPIATTFQDTDQRYFNSDTINPGHRDEANDSGNTSDPFGN
jgi:hypothetical protein